MNEKFESVTAGDLDKISKSVNNVFKPMVGRLEKRVELVENGVRLAMEAAAGADFNANEAQRMSRGISPGGEPLSGYNGHSNGDSLGAHLVRQSEGLELLEKTGRVAFELDGGLFHGRAQLAITSDSLGYGDAGVLQPGFGGFTAPLSRSRLVMRDVLPSRPVESGEFAFIKQVSKSEAGTQYAEGSPKAESTADWEAATATIRTFAVHTTISRQVLEDLQELRRVVDTDLVAAVREEEQLQILSGDGLGGNLSGLVGAATAFETTRIQSGDTKLDYMRHAVSQLEEADEVPSFCVLHPADHWKIKGLKDQAANAGAYLLPIASDPGRLWLPVVRTTAISSGTFLIGSSNRALILDRMTARVMISFEHDQNFTKNLGTILAESRLGLAIFSGAGFVVGSFAGSSP